MKKNNHFMRVFTIMLSVMMVIASLQLNVIATSDQVQNDQNQEGDIIEQGESAEFCVQFLDENNAYQQRKDIQNYIELYKDGNLVENVIYEEKVRTDHQDENVYYYMIKNLEKNASYSIKVKDNLNGYTSEQQKVSLKEEDGFYSSDQKITLSLKQYQVSGYIVWEDQDNQEELRPQMDDYFQNGFHILLNGQNYDYAKVTYNQDENNLNQWFFTIEHLYIIDQQGNQASYVLNHQITNYHSESVTIHQDTDDLKIHYTLALSTDKLQLTPAQENTENTRIPKSTTNVERNESTSVTLQWQDENPIENRIDFGHYVLSYTINGVKYDLTYELKDKHYVLSLTDEDRERLHIGSEETLNALVEGSNLLNHQYVFNNLPSKIIETSSDEEKKETNITWELKMVTPPSGYILNSTESPYLLTPMTNYTAKLDIRNGNFSNSPIVQYNEETDSYRLTNLDQFTFHFDNQEITLSQLQETFPTANYTVTYDQGYYEIHITGIPRCDYTNKKEIVYGMTMTSPSLSGGDRFRILYNNSGIPKFGNITTKCHDTGTIVLIRYGTTNYKATKIWLDDGRVERPTTTWVLWRYSTANSEASYKTPSPVYGYQNDKLVQVTFELESDTSGEEEETIYRYGLPKYDSFGYAYVYFAREEMSGDNQSLYAKHFGTVEQNFKDDVLPQSMTEREGNNQSIYNGGTITNRVENTITVNSQKSWKAANYQSEISNVIVTLTLQKKWVNGDDDYSAVQINAGQDDEGHTIYKDYTVQLTGFNEENMMQAVSVSMPQYDEYGRELQYRFVETAIHEKGNEKNLLVNHQFQTSINATNSLVDGEEYYVSTMDANGHITKKLVGTTHYDVTKIWNHVPEEEIPDSIDITLEQRDASGVIVGEYTYQVYKRDGWKLTITDYPENATNKKGEKVEGKLPKYDENGAKYTYQAVEETQNPNWAAIYVYNKDENNHDKANTVRITNTKGDGISKYIKVRKVWLDNGDELHRENVTVQVWRKAMQDPTKNLNETEDQYITTVTLTDTEEIWWDYAFVTEYWMGDGTTSFTGDPSWSNSDKAAHLIWNGQYYLKEVKVGNHDVDRENINARGYPTVEGTYHNYEVIENVTSDSYSQYYDHEYYTLINRRIGATEVTATKTWIDGYNASEEQRRSYGAKVVLKSNSGDNVVIGNEDDKGYVQVGNEKKEYILDQNNQSISYQQELNGQTTQTIAFKNLPKYDEKGQYIQYDIGEICSVDENGMSKLEKNEYSINIGMQNTGNEDIRNDSLNYSITNQKSYTKTVSFHKTWIDEYTYTKDLRPDIYLTLYKTQYDRQGNVTIVMCDYIDQKWVKTNEDSDYEWTCYFQNLPKYDEKGNEIFYYAYEGMHIDASQYDYLPVQYQYEDQSLSTVNYDDSTVQTSIDNNKVRKINGRIILKEGGTFINELNNNISVKGQKVWENIPEGFPKNQFPKIQFYVQREITKDQYDAILANPSQDTEVVKDGDTYWQNVAWTNPVSEQMNSLTFKFVMSYVGLNINAFAQDSTETGKRKLAKYNPLTGELYNYRVTEKLDAQEGDVTPAYKAFPGEVHNYEIINTYNIDESENLANIQVTKDWDNVDHHYPVVEITLYRFAKDKNDTGITGIETVETVKINKNKGEKSYLFDNLPIISPNGNRYIYYVVEKNINGYTSNIRIDENTCYPTTATDANIDLKKWPVAVTNAFILKGQQTTPNLLEQAINVLTGDNGLTTTEVKVTNTYNTGSVELSGQKTWNDYSNKLSTRPQFIELQLYRYANTQKGANNAIEKELFATATVSENGTVNLKNSKVNLGNLSITRTVNQDQWNYTIRGLDQYAPNGELWKYEVMETPLSYYDTASSIKTGNVSTNTGHISSVDFENTLMTTSLKTTKSWAEINADIQKYNVTFALQVSENGTDWQWARTYFTNKDILGQGQEPFVVEKTLDGSHGQSEIVFTDLPKYVNLNNDNQSITKLQYRVKEVKIGDQYIHFGNLQTYYTKSGNNESFNNAMTALDYSTTQSTIFHPITDSRHTTTNTLTKKTSFTVTKQWSDQDNKYDTRYLENDHWVVKYHVYRSYVKNNQTIQELMKVSNGQDPYILRVEGSDSTSQTASTTVENLPSKTLDGKDYTYFAVELDPNNQEINNNIYYGTYDVSGNSSTFTNTLKTVDLKVTKNWINDNDVQIRPESIKVKLYRKTDSTGYTPVKVRNIQGNLEDYTMTISKDAWQVTFAGLPMCDHQGNLYTYKAEEVSTVPGYHHPVYSKTTPIATTNVDNDYQMTITNTAIELKLDKRDNNGPITNKAVEIHIEGTANTATAGYQAIWSRNASGNESVTVTKNGTPIYTMSGSITVIKGLPQGDYTLSEVVTPLGYEKINNQTFTITNSGVTEKSSVLSYNDKTLSIHNTPVEIQVNKKDLQNQPLTGAIFTITPVDDSIFADGTTVTRTIDFGSNSSYTITDLVIGHTYELEETKAPDGYILPGGDTASHLKIQLKVTDDGKIVTSGEGAYTVTGVDNNYVTVNQDTLTVKNKVIEITLNKKDYIDNQTNEDQKGLINGATFTLSHKKSDGTYENVQKVTVSKGTITLSKLIGGDTYRLVETSVPTGYQTLKGYIEYTVTTDGNVSHIVFEKNDDQVLASSQNNVLNIYNKRIPGTLNIEKVDKDDNTKLSGITFELKYQNAKGDYVLLDQSLSNEGVLTTNSDITSRATVVTDNEGKASYSHLPWGNYKLIETSFKDGYKTNRSEYDVVIGPEDNHITVDQTIKNEKIQLSFGKMSSKSQAYLAKATFTLESLDGKGFVNSLPEGVTENNGILTWISEASTKLFNGVLKAEGKYKLTETKAPDGYELPENYAVIFTVQKDGSLVINEVNVNNQTLTSDYSQYISLDSQKVVLTLKDTPIHITLTKVDSSDPAKTLAGAQFELYDITDKSSIIDKGQFTTNAQGQIEFNESHFIYNHTYRLVETKAADGYKLPDALTIEFTIAQDGNILNITSNKEEYLIDNQQDLDAMTIQNEPIIISLKKTDYVNHTVETKPALENVKFVIKENGQVVDAISQETKGQTIGTNENGELIFVASSLIQGHTYQLYELKNNGYTTDNETLVYTFTVDSDGTVIHNGQDTNEALITLTNKRIPGTLTVEKVDQDNRDTKLSNTTFELRYKENGEWKLLDQRLKADGTLVILTSQEDIKDRAILTTNDLGQIVYNELPWGEYQLTELTAKDGYVITQSVHTFTISKEALEKTYTDQDVITNQKTRISFDKISNVGSQTLSGAQFELTPVNGSEFAIEKDKITWTSDKDHSFTLDGYLITGHTYQLKETVSPSEYSLPKDYIVIFKVNNDGTVTIQSVHIDNQEVTNIHDYVLVSSDHKTIQVKDDPLSITFDKKDIHGNAIESTRGEAVFKLVEESKTIAENLTMTNGSLTIDNANGSFKLEKGKTYQLIETTAPKGYELTTITFSFNDYGLPVVNEIVQNDCHVEIRDQMVDINLTKTGMNTLESIENDTIGYASFMIEPVSGSTFADGSTTKIENITTTNVNTVLKGQLVAGNQYLLKEVLAPKGYETSDVVFEVNADGTIKVISGQGIVSDHDSTRLYVRNQKTSLTLQKVNKNGASIESKEHYAHFTITGTFAGEGYTSYNVTSANIEETLKGKLISSEWYTLEEIQTLNTYYKPSPMTIRFMLDSQGNIKDNYTVTMNEKSDEETKAYVQVSGSQLMIENDDFTTQLEFYKQDSSSQEGINGAVFKLYYSETPFVTTVQDGENKGDILTNRYQNSFVQEVASDSNGKVSLNLTKKGHYLLIETSNTGYQSDHFMIGTFDIGDEDYNQTLSLDDVSMNVIQGTMTNDKVVNDRILGSVTLYKLNDRHQSLEGVEFKLLKQETLETPTFIDWLKGLFTGKSYVAQTVDGQTQTINGSDLIDKGQLTISNLPWGTYQLIEVKAKDGYSTASGSEAVCATIEFTIDRESAKVVELNTNGNQFYNYQTSLTIIKTNGTSPLAGAKFKITGEYIDTDGNKTNQPLEVITDSQGKIDLKGQLIGGNTYTLQELVAPDGYERDNHEIQFMVHTDGHIEITSETGKYTLLNSTFFDNQISLQNTEISIDINKESKDHQSIDHATFDLYLGNEKIKEGLTTSQGHITLNRTTVGRLLLKNTEYRLVETNAPSGYELTAISFIIDEYGTVNNVHTISGYSGSVSAEGSTITVVDDKIDLSIDKQDFDTKTTITNRGNAQFTVTGEFVDGTTSKTVTSDNMSALTGQIIAGHTYTMEETKAPEGYELAAKFTFKVDQYGMINHINGQKVAPIQDSDYVGSDHNQFIVRDKPITIQLEKQDLEGHAIETDNSYAIFKVSGTFADGATEITDITTANVHDKLKGLLVVGNQYTLTETKAPDGYKLGDVIIFTVQDDGTIVINNQNSSDKIVVKDQPITINLKKYDSHQNPIEETQLGYAQFKVTGTFSDGTEEKTVTSANIATVLNTQLIAGNQYTFIEVKAPDGYELAGTLTIEVHTDGTISAVEDNNQWTIDNGQSISQINVYDQSIVIHIKKLNNDNEGLKNATFALYLGDQYMETLITDENGNVSMNHLIQGKTYTLKETVAPEGYKLLSDTILFTVGDDGRPSINEYEYVQINNETIEILNEETEISFVKRILHDQETNVEGAVLTITGHFAHTDETTIEWTSSSTPEVFRNLFIVGETYELKELQAPHGAMFDENYLVTFTINEDGNIVFDSENITYDQDNHMVVIWNQPTEVAISKVDATTMKPLENATLQVKDGQKVIDEWETDGREHIITGLLEGGKTYTLHEVKAPNGYQLAKDIKFVVNINEITTITMEDARDPQGNPDLIIYKVDQNENFLTGASFKLVKVVDQHEVTIAAQSGGPRFEFSNIKDGVYRIYETKAPAGYQGLDTYFEIEVKFGNIYYQNSKEISFTVYNKNDGTHSEVFGGVIDEEDYIHWEESVKTSDNQNIFEYSILSLVSLLLIFIFKKKREV